VLRPWDEALDQLESGVGVGQKPALSDAEAVETTEAGQAGTANSPDEQPRPLPPITGSVLGSEENADWVAGRIGSFFFEATILDAQRFLVGERVEDRKTLLEASGVDPRRVLI